MVWMTVFHFCFDLQHFGYFKADFYTDPVWTLQRSAIVSLFLFCAGISQAVAVQQGQTWPRFWKRWRLIAFCAALVTVGSYLMYPGSFIYFGVLHGIALMLVIVRLTAGWGRWLWLLGCLPWLLYWAAPYIHAAWAGFEFLNSPMFNWLGLVSRKPVTEDYVPLAPWLGVMWWGFAAGTWALKHHTSWFQGQLTQGGRALAVLGRWSLSYYMLHQPVLIGLLLLAGLLR